MLEFLISMITGNVIYPLIVPGLMAGIIAIVVSFFIPSTFTQYKLPLLIGGILAVLFFVFYAGKYSEESKYKLELAEAQLTIAYLEGKQTVVTKEIEYKYIDRVKEITKIKVEYQDVYVDRFITEQADAACSISNGFVRVHNSSAKGIVPGTPEGTDDSTSSFKLSDVAYTVSENYLTYNQVKSQLTLLQEWITRQQLLVKESSSDLK